jgi:hypothetical protein
MSLRDDLRQAQADERGAKRARAGELDGRGSSPLLLKTVVERHFGTANGAVVRAVGELFARTQSLLDLANVELVAAASPFLGPDHTANLVRDLPLTQLPIAMAPVDIEAVREQFRIALGKEGGDGGAPPLEPVVAARLVKSLIQDTTIRSLELSPAERLPEPSVELVRAKLDQDIRSGNLEVVKNALASAHLTSEQWVKIAHKVIALPDGHPNGPVLFGQLASSVPGALPISKAAAEVLDRLARHPDVDVRERLAVAENVPFETMRALTLDLDLEVAQRASRNRTYLDDTLNRLAEDLGVDVGDEAAADRSGVAPAVLDRLANDDDPLVRLHVAGSANAQAETLDRLANDDDPLVRLHVAGSANAQAETLDRLANDQDEDVRYAVAENPRTGAATLDRLARDEVEDVRLSVAENPKAGVGTLGRLASDQHDRVRYAVAENPSTSSEALDLLAGDERQRLRHAVARNPSTSSETLRRLAGDDVVRVRAAAAAALEPIDKPHPQPSLSLLDPHEAFGIATDPEKIDLLPEGVDHPAHKQITEVVDTVRGGLPRPSARLLKHWRHLPTQLDVPIDLPIDPFVVESREICDLKGTVARTGRELERLHERMGNCLDHYIDPARRGEVVIASFEDPENHEVYAVAWRRKENETFELFEVNSMHNEANLPKGFEEAVTKLGGELHRPFVQPVLDRQPAAGRRRRTVRAEQRQCSAEEGVVLADEHVGDAALPTPDAPRQDGLQDRRDGGLAL